jgi:putative tryptophan/tyrosine transport system substrate-binding protein
MLDVKRRQFITLLGGAAAAAAWPLAARAQQSRVPVIGFLGFGTSNTFSPALRRGLAEAGYILGKNVEIEFRWANFQHSALPRLASELVERGVAAIVTTGSPYAAAAAKAATSTIPIIFQVTEDPVNYGLVASFNRPGGNVTGVNFLSSEIAGKRLSLLLEVIPRAARIGYLSGPSESPVFEAFSNNMLAAGRALGREIVVLEVRRFDFPAAFAKLVEDQAGALIVGDFTFFYEPRNRDQILDLAARHNVPTVFPNRLFTLRGGLMSYAASESDTWRQVGIYTARVLKGARPADLPVLQPTRFELVINLKTAKALGVEVPPTVLAIANEVIE